MSQKLHLVKSNVSFLLWSLDNDSWLCARNSWIRTDLHERRRRRRYLRNESKLTLRIHWHLYRESTVVVEMEPAVRSSSSDSSSSDEGDDWNASGNRPSRSMVAGDAASGTASGAYAFARAADGVAQSWSRKLSARLAHGSNASRFAIILIFMCNNVMLRNKASLISFF